MDEVCCRECQHHFHRHSICGGRCGGEWNAHKRYPNYISGYTGNIPINLCWKGDEHPCETRNFISQNVAPVNTFYVVHSSQYLPDGSLELPKVHSQIPESMLHTIAKYSNHPHIVSECKPCNHGFSGMPDCKGESRAFGNNATCGCGRNFVDYRVTPPGSSYYNLKCGKMV
ncbi:uncharacterized protein [Parasteatoda tepidariorum]|uniref:uncharacterized protein n=1 Tax=Parasteatoda tepidariorum TaxID=114398 RepID=UPI00077F89ED|nr:uncharacterized protein LOC107448358 [Parasteatoda tepidariorum]